MDPSNAGLYSRPIFHECCVPAYLAYLQHEVWLVHPVAGSSQLKHHLHRKHKSCYYRLFQPTMVTQVVKKFLLKKPKLSSLFSINLAIRQLPQSGKSNLQFQSLSKLYYKQESALHDPYTTGIHNLLCIPFLNYPSNNPAFWN